MSEPVVERKDRRGKDDDVPIIGDFTDEFDARRGARARESAPPPPSPPPPSPRPRQRAPAQPAPEPMIAERSTRERGVPEQQWRHDPNDLRRRKQRMRAGDRAGPLSTIVRYALIATVVAAVVIGYRNFETVRSVALDVVARVVGSLAERQAGGDSASPANGEPDTVVVEREQIAGTPLPSAIGGAPPAENTVTPAEQVTAQAPPLAAPAAELGAASEQVVVAEPEPVVVPEPPPGPETFELASAVVTVSEAAASAAVLVLRNGDRSRVSTVVWSTRDGTATAGSDYIDRGAVVERFAAGEQNRTIHVPIVGDRNTEGSENFYVVLAADDSAAADLVREVQVVIGDDD